MFGKPEWFTYRTFGWGIKAKTWQGWVYICVFVALLVCPNFLPIDAHLKKVIPAFVFWLGLADVILLWSQLDRVHDEREQLHQLIIERNCSLAAVCSLCALIGYRSYPIQLLPASGSYQLNTGIFPFDPLLLGVLGVMMATKLASTLYLRHKG